MTRHNFIQANKEELDRYIKKACGLLYTSYRINYAEREEWILNDESLYRWAKSEGIKI